MANEHIKLLQHINHQGGKLKTAKNDLWTLKKKIILFICLCQFFIVACETVVAGKIWIPDQGSDRPFAGSSESKPLDHQVKSLTSYLYSKQKMRPRPFQSHGRRAGRLAVHGAEEVATSLHFSLTALEKEMATYSCSCQRSTGARQLNMK